MNVLTGIEMSSTKTKNMSRENRDMLLHQVAGAGRHPVSPLVSHHTGHPRETHIAGPTKSTQKRTWLPTVHDPITPPTKIGRQRVPYLLRSVWTQFGSGALMHLLDHQERTMNLKASPLPGPPCLSGGPTLWEDPTCLPLRAMSPDGRDMIMLLAFRCSRWRRKSQRDRSSPHYLVRPGNVLTARIEPPASSAGRTSHRTRW